MRLTHRAAAENPSGGEWVMRCSDESWCCASETCCSDKGSTKLNIGNATVTATAGVRESTTSPTSTSSTGSTSSTASSGSSSGSSSTGTLTTSPVSSTSSVQPPEATSSNNNALAIGLGVGLGLGAVAAALGLWMLCRRRRKTDRSMARALGTGGDPYNYSHEAPVPNRILEMDAVDTKKKPVELYGSELHFSRPEK